MPTFSFTLTRTEIFSGAGAIDRKIIRKKISITAARAAQSLSHSRSLAFLLELHAPRVTLLR
jgi:hypothetical protein